MHGREASTLQLRNHYVESYDAQNDMSLTTTEMTALAQKSHL
jgi:hypothetical protein